MQKRMTLGISTKIQPLLQDILLKEYGVKYVCHGYSLKGT